jgi:membrane-associated phospholipid phosphatase
MFNLAMPFDDTINDISALGGLPAFLVIAALITAIVPPASWLALALMFLGGLAGCYIVTVAIRWVWFRTRPVPAEHHNWWQRIDASSFPSMHTMRAAFLATVLIILLQYSVIAIIVCSCAALAVAWARVRKKRHHVSDVVVGIILGVIIALLSMVLMVAVPTWF